MGIRVLKSAITKLGNRVELLGNDEDSLSSKTLIIGVFHGDEPQGKYLIDKYVSEKSNVSALFIPCLNPDGMQNNTRTNANGVDLNRNFPTKNWGEDTSAAGSNPADYYGGNAPAGEIETKFLVEVIDAYKPKAVLTLHSPYKVVNYDGPAKELAEKISAVIGYPVEGDIGYPTPGSFGTYCGVEKNIPTITLELDEKIPVEELIQPVFKIFEII